MTEPDLDTPAQRLAQRYAGRVESSFGQDTVDVPRAAWPDAVAVARGELEFTYFDWLTAVDQLDDADEPGFDVVTHLWSLARREHLLLRTRVPAPDPVLATVTGVFAGASWHERETFEMFGIVFDGHPNLVPLLLPDGFEGNPLRKDFVLAARAAKAWPGAKEPGESDGDAPSRRKNRPPGVPDPDVWGPRPDRPVLPAAPETGNEAPE
ncbi:MAG TPA: NADH-quinone oxidoreductase subunit C [Actinomycetes bacterium]